MKTISQNRNTMYTLPIKEVEDQTKLILRIEHVLQSTPKGTNRDFLESFLENMIQKEMINTCDLPPKYSRNVHFDQKTQNVNLNVKSKENVKKEKSKNKGISFTSILNSIGFGSGKKSRNSTTEAPIIPYNKGDSPIRPVVPPEEKKSQTPCITTQRLVTATLPSNPKTEEENFMDKVMSTPYRLNCPFDKITLPLSFTQMSTICEECS